MITAEQNADIRNRDANIREWLRVHKTNSYKSEELSLELGIELPTNQERSASEVFEFVTNPPEKYFLYISAPKPNVQTLDRIGYFSLYGMSGEATTWTGERLGSVQFGREFRDNFGGKRIPISVHAINGKTYHGTYYKSAGDYARVKMAKS